MNTGFMLVKQCKATYPKIWSGCDSGALIRVVCHRKAIPHKISEKSFFLNFMSIKLTNQGRKCSVCKYIYISYTKNIVQNLLFKFSHLFFSRCSV